MATEQEKASANARTKASPPGWVWWFMAAGVAVVALALVMMLAGHGSWQHMAMPK